MKRVPIMVVLILCALSATVYAQNVSTGISISNGQLSSFYFSIGDYYRVPESRVVYVRDRYHIHDEELPVVFFLASRAKADPQVIMDLRMRKHMSWLDITFHYGLTPEIFYVPVRRVGPPYGNAYGHYKKYKNDYKKVRLVDDDVVNLVNLRFMSDYHGVAPEAIMDRRGKGDKFYAMNDEYYKAKQKNDKHEQKKEKENNKKDKNGNQGKGNRKG